MQVGRWGVGLLSGSPVTPSSAAVPVRHCVTKARSCHPLQGGFHSVEAKAKEDPSSWLRGGFPVSLRRTQLKIPAVREQVEAGFVGEAACCQPNKPENGTVMFVNCLLTKQNFLGRRSWRKSDGGYVATDQQNPPVKDLTLISAFL